MESYTETLLGQILDKHKEEMTNFFTDQIIEMRRLFQWERQFLQDEVKQTQNDILGKINELHQENKKMTDLQATLNDKVVGLEERIDSLSNKLKNKMKKNTAVITGHLFDISKDAMAKTTENMKNLMHEHQEKITKPVDDNQKKITSSICQPSDNITSVTVDMASEMVVKQDYSIKECVTDSLDHSSQEISSRLSETYENIKQTRPANNDMESSQVKLPTDVVQHCTCMQTIEDKLEKTKKELSVKLTAAKMQIFSFIEKEAQITRNRQISILDLKAKKKYVFDLFVENFTTLINSDQEVNSCPWHVDKLKSSVQGRVWFPSGGNMTVRLLYGRHPREMGLKPRSGVRLRVTATVKDISNTLTDIKVGSGTWNCDEATVKDNDSWGILIGTASCQTLIDAGFGDKEGYARGAILIRYDIEVV